MLHLSSLHYYACYYALLCLLHQQQQAHSVTIFIDGATTREWDTRSQYQRLVDGAQAADKLALASGNDNLAAVRMTGDSNSNSNNNNNNNGGNARSGAEPDEQILRSMQATFGNRPPASNQQRLVVGAPVDENSNEATQDVLSATLGGAPTTTNDLDTALSQLEVIERERTEQLHQLNKLKSLEKAAEIQVASALVNNQEAKARLLAAAAARNSDGDGYAGARTISDLVPVSDDDFEAPSRHLVERETPKRYCGEALMDLLDMVCERRFYAGNSEPQVVNPTVKTKRSVDYAEALAAGRVASEVGSGGVGSNHGAVSRRRKQRTAPADSGAVGSMAGDGRATLARMNGSNDNNNNNMNDGNNNHNQQYLSTEQASAGEYSPNARVGNGSGANRKHGSGSGAATTTGAGSAKKYRRIRGASSTCCARACQVDELKPYCAQKA